MEATQRPLELILARNLLSSVSTAAFLISAEGVILFYNQAAGALLGRPFEETGALPAEEWTQTWGPLDENDQPIPYEKQPLTLALARSRAAHLPGRIRSLDGTVHAIETSALAIVGDSGFQGAMVFFWKTDQNAS